MRKWRESAERGHFYATHKISSYNDCYYHNYLFKNMLAYHAYQFKRTVLSFYFFFLYNNLNNLHDIFNFYEELDILKEQCIKKTLAAPFPLLGFMSPTLFVCKDIGSKCKHLSGSHKTITLIKQQGGLMPGRYHRCSLLTPKLHDYYLNYYKEIKNQTQKEQK